ncbi:hypothetical protein [Parafilimonas sp.]|uniref:hypothetical protein n=1 Tax=Parafilimonas sp. TaxID=1969739 RepID=UPI0039E52BA2
MFLGIIGIMLKANYFFGDKMYKDEDWFEAFEEQTGSKMLTAVKAVSTVRQPANPLLLIR